MSSTCMPCANLEASLKQKFYEMFEGKQWSYKVQRWGANPHDWDMLAKRCFSVSRTYGLKLPWAGVRLPVGEEYAPPTIGVTSETAFAGVDSIPALSAKELQQASIHPSPYSEDRAKRLRGLIQKSLKDFEGSTRRETAAPPLPEPSRLSAYEGVLLEHIPLVLTKYNTPSMTVDLYTSLPLYEAFARVLCPTTISTPPNPTGLTIAVRGSEGGRELSIKVGSDE